MKKIILSLMSVLFLNLLVANGQALKARKKKDDPSVKIILLFDYESKEWKYGNEELHRRGKVYFLIPYKSQPVIKVINVPLDFKVEIESSFIDVSPQNEKSKTSEEKDNELKQEEIEKVIKQKTDTLMALQIHKDDVNTDLFMILPRDDKSKVIGQIDLEIEKLQTEIAAANEEKNELESILKNIFVQTSQMVDSDEAEYTVTIHDKEGKLDHKTSAYAKVYRGLKIDLSTGILFHNLFDDSFHYEDGSATESTIVKDKGNDRIRPLFPVVFTHVYWRTKHLLSPGISLGLGIDDEGKAGYYLGPALLLGDRQRAVISLGWALRPTDVLKGKYTNRQLIDDVGKPEVSDLVESSFKSGFFFALTYNLTTKVEKRK